MGTRSVASAVEEATPRGIAAGIARLITSGELAPGDRLPTVRDLATALGVSPATVSHAWQALSATGLIVSRGRSGSFVRALPRQWLPPRYRDVAGQPNARLDLSTGTPDPDLLPPIGPVLGNVAQRADTSSYFDVPVIPELERLLRDSWPYPPAALTVVDGALDAIGRTLEQVAGYGARVVVENPGFPPILDLLDQVAAERVPVGVDEQGMRPELLAEAMKLSPAAVLLQPRAHNPTGASMTQDRARDLAAVIRQGRNPDTVVIEDDHSGQISVAPDVSLGRWLPEQVVHVRSFSKSHGPDLRLAALGGPESLVDRIVARRLLGPAWTSRMLQSILVELMTRQDSIERVFDARRVYHARQRAFAEAMTAAGVPLAVADGINAWVPVVDERAAIVKLAAEGIRVAAGTPYFGGHAEPRIRVTSGLIRSDFEEVAAVIAAASRA